MPGHPQLSASLDLKKGSERDPFLCEERRLGIRTPKKEAPFRTPPFSERFVSLALHLGRLGHGFAFGRERAVVDAAA